MEEYKPIGTIRTNDVWYCTTCNTEIREGDDVGFNRLKLYCMKCFKEQLLDGVVYTVIDFNASPAVQQRRHDKNESSGWGQDPDT